MAKFRQKPVVVEAEQWWPGKPVTGSRGEDPNMMCGCVILYGSDCTIPHVHPSPIAAVPLEPGDWVVLVGIRPAGSYYDRIPDAEFRRQYELAEA